MHFNCIKIENFWRSSKLVINTKELNNFFINSGLKLSQDEFNLLIGEI